MRTYYGTPSRCIVITSKRKSPMEERQYFLAIDDQNVEPATFDSEGAALTFAKQLIDDEGNYQN